MNGRIAKLVRRDARRLVGTSAVRAIEAQGTALDVTIPTVNALDARTTDLNARMGALKARLDELVAWQRAFSNMTRWGRLRWLCQGKKR